MTNTRDELADELNQAFNRFLHAPEGGQSRGNAKALLERIMWDNVAEIITHLRARPPAQQPEAGREELREAAVGVIKVWQEAPYGVDFGSFMERALSKLDAALATKPAQDK